MLIFQYRISYDKVFERYVLRYIPGQDVHVWLCKNMVK